MSTNGIQYPDSSGWRPDWTYIPYPMTPLYPYYPMPTLPMPAQMGWQCARCGAIHAPFVPGCHCGPPTVTASTYVFGSDQSSET